MYSICMRITVDSTCRHTRDESWTTPRLKRCENKNEDNSVHAKKLNNYNFLPGKFVQKL